MKRIITFFIFIISIFILSSCNFSLLSSDNDDLGHSLEYSYDESVKDDIKEAQKIVEDNLKNNVPFKELYNSLMDVDSYIMDIATYSSIEYLNYSITGNITNQTKYMEFSAYTDELIEWETDILRQIYSSDYKEDFFPGMTDEEIIEYIGPEYTDEYYEYDSQVAEIISEYNNLSEEEMLQETPSLYIEAVDLYNKMAKEAGYDNYLDFSYKNVYGRDYTPDDVSDFSSYVKEYIVPKFFELYNSMESSMSRLSKRNYSKASTYLMGNYTNCKSIFDDYAKRIGGKYYTNYVGLWDNGYYFFADSDKSINGAYTTYLYNLDTPAVYFGPDYQTITTVVHEFGHYYAYKNQGGGASMDLCETQSQGNEFLFLAYVEQESQYVSQVTDFIKEYSMMQALSTVIFSTVVNEFEKQVYEASSLTEVELDNIIISIFNEYGGYENYKGLFDMDPKDYWKYVALENAGYYISYAVSLIPSISLYSIANEDLDKGIDSYLDICKYSFADKDYLTALSDAGLYNPFSEESFVQIIASI